MHLLISLTALLLSTVAARPLHSTPTILHDVTIIDECVSSLESAAPDYDGSFKQAWAMYKTANKLKGAGQSAKHAVDKVDHLEPADSAAITAEVAKLEPKFEAFLAITDEKLATMDTKKWNKYIKSGHEKVKHNMDELFGALEAKATPEDSSKLKSFHGNIDAAFEAGKSSYE